MALRFVCQDREGVRVECDEQNWLVHEARHPEISGHEDWVRQTIEDPLVIYQSDTHVVRMVLFRPYTFDRRVCKTWSREVVVYKV